MFIKSLFLRNFRNIEEAQLQFSEKLNIFIGDNGHGKTNVLEALYLLLEKESFRYTNNATLIRLQQSQSVLNSFIHNNNLDFHFKMNMTPSRKEFFVNDKKNFSSDEFQFRAILFSPESLNVIKESAEQRRDLVDQMVASSSNMNAKLIKDYKKALRTRNKILKDSQNGVMSKDLATDTLLSINPIFLDLAHKLTLARLKILSGTKSLVQDFLNQLNQNTAELGRPVYGFNYIFSENEFFEFDETKISIKIMQILAKRAQELMSAELSFGTSLIGPQKHDIVFLYNGNDSRFFCSQGQQRTIILAFKMAQIVYHHRVHGFYPVLLLDDVLSELDQNKQEALISTLNEIKTQTFLTTTDLNSIKKLNVGSNLQNLNLEIPNLKNWTTQEKIFSVREGIILENDRTKNANGETNADISNDGILKNNLENFADGV